MSQTSPTPNQRVVTELKVSAHLMLLDPGLFCIFHSPGGPSPDPVTGLPGVRVTRPPAVSADALSISTFNPDGWLGGEGNAALVRVTGTASQVLVTIYQMAGSAQEAPNLQVLRLSEAAPVRTPAPAPAAAPAVAEPAPVDAESPEKAEVAAHVQRRGDVLARLGDWMGERGSQSWIEGFAISPARLIEPADIEYQAVLGKGWLSPWSEGGQYCGSRGMALPILGLRVRLKGEAAGRNAVRVSATFTDGTSVGPLNDTDTAESPSLAPLEAFLVEILPVNAAEASTAAEEQTAATVMASGKASPPAAKPVARPAAPAARPSSPVQRPGKTGLKGRR